MYNISAVSNLVEHDKVLKKAKQSHQIFDAPVFSIDKSSKKATRLGSEASTYDKQSVMSIWSDLLKTGKSVNYKTLRKVLSDESIKFPEEQEEDELMRSNAVKPSELVSISEVGSRPTKDTLAHSLMELRDI